MSDWQLDATSCYVTRPHIFGTVFAEAAHFSKINAGIYFGIGRDVSV